MGKPNKTRKGKSSNASLGKALANNLNKKSNKKSYISELHQAEDRVDTFVDLKSVLEQDSLNEFADLVALSEKKIEVEKRANIINSADLVTNPDMEMYNKIMDQTGVNRPKYAPLKLPRKPKWSKTWTKEQLVSAENKSFLEWRRDVANMEEGNINLAITPFEKNLGVWKQLWSVIEQCQLLIQIVDARNPYFYYSADLERYIKELDENKQYLLLINKADYLDDSQRQHWHEYFKEKGVQHVFFSALEERKKMEARKTATIPKPHKEVVDTGVDNNILDDIREAITKEDVEVIETETVERLAKGQTIDLLNNYEFNTVETEEEKNKSDSKAKLCVENIIQSRTDEETEDVVEEKSENEEGDQEDTELANEAEGEQDGEGDQEEEGENNSDNGEGESDNENTKEQAQTQPEPELPEDEDDSTSATDLMIRLIRVYVRQKCGTPQGKDNRYNVGMIGYPNVGKSSVINCLCGAKRVAVGARPGKTKHFQTINLGPDMTLYDCPGLVFPSFASSKEEMVCCGVIPIDNLRDYNTPMELVKRRIPKNMYEQVYKIELPDDYTTSALLQIYSAYKGFVTGRGLPDENKAARTMLKDYCSGKLLFVHLRPDYDSEKHGEVNQTNVKYVLKDDMDALTSQNEESKFESISEFSQGSASTEFGKLKIGSMGDIAPTTMKDQKEIEFDKQYFDHKTQQKLSKAQKRALKFAAKRGMNPDEVDLNDPSLTNPKRNKRGVAGYEKYEPKKTGNRSNKITHFSKLEIQ